ncbi:MAG: methyl-accepting chemotaxis protein [Desulfotomaculales bacterium]
MSLRLKIVGGFLSVLLLVVVLGGVSYYELKALDRSYTELIVHRTALISTAKDVLVNYEHAALMVRTFLLTGQPEYVDEYRTAARAAAEKLQFLEAHVDTPEGRELLAKLNAAHRTFGAYAEELIAVGQRAPSAQQRLAESERITLQYKGTARAVTRAGQDFTAYQEQLLAESAARNQARVRRAFGVSGGVMVAFVVLGTAAAVLMAGRLVRPLKNLEQAASRVAKGDLTGERIAVGTRDEVAILAESFNHMREQLRTLVAKLAEQARVVSGAAQQLSEGTRRAADGASQVSGSMAEISAAMEQITGHVQRAAEDSRQAAGYAGEGTLAMERTTGQFAAMSQAAERVGAAVNELHGKIGEITRILDVINHIAEQTNLLALNAAIEAARAGEQGRGFAVVAEEVRKLAVQATQATKEIYQLIATVQEESRRAVAAMAGGTRTVEEGAAVIGEASESFRKIIRAVEHLSREVQEIAAATQEVSASVQHVTAATQEQSATVEQISATAETLNRMARELTAATSGFRV